MVWKIRKKHGHNTVKHRTATYNTWASMKQRCLNPKNPKYNRWGGRGIKICDKWLQFSGFFEDMGERPTNCTIERIDNNLGYNKENCRWATVTQQQRNRRITKRYNFHGKLLTASEISETCEISEYNLFYRLSAGWNPDDAVTIPPRRYIKRA